MILSSLRVHTLSREVGSRFGALPSKAHAGFARAVHNAPSMKARHLSLAIAALLATGGLWFARSAWPTHASQKSSKGAGFKAPHGPNFDSNGAASLRRASQAGPASGPNNRPQPGQMFNPPARLAPPEPYRRFTDFTPEQRVQFARDGHGPGG